MTVKDWIPIAIRQKYQKSACEKCGSAEHLGLHHIDTNRRNNSPDNLLTLCPNCHTDWHWKHGKQAWKRLGKCLVCDKPARRQGYCETHSSRYRRHGSPYLVKKRIGSSWQLVEDRS
ncbi:MAG TPA: HNH endonuclease [Anaerolineae bacterium]|nr:HNH endonuclease [Anaerolineae bacterium]